MNFVVMQADVFKSTNLLHCQNLCRLTDSLGHVKGVGSTCYPRTEHVFQWGDCETNQRICKPQGFHKLWRSCRPGSRISQVANIRVNGAVILIERGASTSCLNPTWETPQSVAPLKNCARRLRWENVHEDLTKFLIWTQGTCKGCQRSAKSSATEIKKNHCFESW